MIKPLIAPGRRDAGFTLIEVLVALLVFAVISTGIVAGTTTVMRMTADNRARITAANLASQDLDLVRALKDPFSVSALTTRTFLSRTAFTVTRTVKWVSTGGEDVACSGGTALLYLRVNVRVDWDGRLAATAPVQDDTLMAPVGRTSTSGTGSIAILVKDEAGNPLAGVNVTVTPQAGGGGQALPTQPVATTADGCTYANQVEPGTYVVKAAKAGYVDPSGAGGSSTQSVIAGQTAQAPFELDRSGSYTTGYAPYPVTVSPAPLLASDMPTTFLSTGRTIVTAAPTASVSLPAASGYTAVAGLTAKGASTCPDADPMSWPADQRGPAPLQQGIRASGSGTGFSIPVGVVQVFAPTGVTITAQRPVLASLPAEPGSLVPADPGCDVTGPASQLTWAQKGTGGVVSLALPYGTWRIYENGVLVPGALLSAPSNATPSVGTPSGVITLDPRKQG